MFDFRLIHFPVFNVADIFICAGGVLFVLYFLCFSTRKQAKRRSNHGELQFTVPAEQSGKRIDSWLAEQIEGLTRSAAQNLLSEQA